ncbi:hypothetical protein Celaphus_00006678, partial [Cervus elaphus hippelaphus]
MESEEYSSLKVPIQMATQYSSFCKNEPQDPQESKSLFVPEESTERKLTEGKSPPIERCSENLQDKLVADASGAGNRKRSGSSRSGGGLGLCPWDSQTGSAPSMTSVWAKQGLRRSVPRPSTRDAGIRQGCEGPGFRLTYSPVSSPVAPLTFCPATLRLAAALLSHLHRHRGSGLQRAKSTGLRPQWPAQFLTEQEQWKEGR